MKKLKVLFLITDFGKGGAERFLIDLCTELLKRDEIEFKIGTLYATNEYKELTSNFAIANLDYQTFSIKGKNECPAYKKLLEEFKPDIIHSHRFLAEFLTSYYVDSSRRYVCHGHDNMVQLGNFSPSSLFNKRSFFRFIEKSRLIRSKYRKAPTYFISNSSHTDKYFKKVLPAGLRKQVHKLEYGFNFNKFYDPNAKSMPENEELQFINVGSFQRKKNQQFLIDVAYVLKEKGIEFKMHFLGNGACLNEVKEKTKNKGLEKNVVFHGNVDRVENHLRRCHIYLHSARYEPFGLVYLEAMAAGLPCITLDGKGNRDIFDQEGSGILLESEDAQLFAQKVMDLCSDKKRYAKLSISGKEISRHYSIENKTRELIDFYHKITAG